MPAEHRRRRSLVQPALHHQQVQHYVQTMVTNADAVIDTWQPGQTLTRMRGPPGGFWVVVSCLCVSVPVPARGHLKTSTPLDQQYTNLG